MADFPEGIIDGLQTLLATIDGVTEVHDRDLTPKDRNGDIGIVYFGWSQTEEPEMGTQVFDSPYANYEFRISHMVKHANRPQGLEQQRLVARAIRSMLAHDPAAKVALLPQVNASDHYTERLKRWNVQGQAFADDFIDKAFFFVSETSVTFQTETV